MRNSMMAVLAAALTAVISMGAAAQNFPTKPITLIVPWPAGGTTDIALRTLAEASQKHLGQPIVVENKPGASGLLGPSEMVANAKPDGYTVSQLALPVFRLPFMSKTTYDPAKDFTFVIHLTGNTFGIVTKADSKFKSFEELLTYAKANPGKVKYGSPGTGTTQHITMEQIAKQRGIKWIHVPFKGSAETNAAVMGGHVDVVADSTGWAGLVNSGELRLLVTWGVERTKGWPSVPTLRESGVNLISNSPFGIGGPKGMDPKVVKILHDAFKKGMEDPAYTAILAKFDQEAFYMDSATYTDFALKLIEEQKQLVEELGLKPR